MRFLVLLSICFLSGCVSHHRSDFSKMQCVEQDVNSDNHEAAKIYIALGLRQLRNDDLDQARSNLIKAVEVAPNMPDSHYNLAYYFQINGDSERANEFYANALRLERLNPSTSNSYGDVLCEQNRYEEAISYFKRSIQNKRYTNNADAYERMAICAETQGHANDAIDYLQTALDLEPGRAKAFVMLVELLTKQKQFEKAKAALDKMEIAGHVSDDFLWLRMDVARQQGKLNEMQEYGDILLSVYPYSPLTKSYLASGAEIAKNNNVTVTPLPEPKPKKTMDKTKPGKWSSSPDVDLAAFLKSDFTNTAPSNLVDESTKGTISDTEVTRPVSSSALSETESPSFHIVKPKQNLYRISKLYDTTVERLMEINALSDTNIHIGMKLWLVPTDDRS